MIKIKHFTRTVKSSLLFDSRTSRVEYWHYVLFSSLLVFLMVIIGEIVTVTDVVVETYEGDARETLFAYSLLVFLPVIAASFRRLHDSNKSGRWLLLPFYNLYLLIRKGTVGPNFYGPDPKAAPLAIPVPPITDSPTV
ncbi:DUF805 domain-containing protein [Patescibacteria group bacterium]|nr:DUF805 domain-containing protein [Patescibacteria group bacterium]